MVMRWKRFQRVIWVLLAACAGGIVLLVLIDGMLVIGPVDSSDIFGILLLIFLLALLAWGDGAIAAFMRGWERVAALAFVLLMEGLFLLTILFFWFYLYTNPRYVPLYDPAGEVRLMVRQESWLFKVWGEFYLPAGPCLLRGTGVTYEAHDNWLFTNGSYELEWEEDQAIICYDTGMGYWETCTVPLK